MSLSKWPAVVMGEPRQTTAGGRGGGRLSERSRPSADPMRRCKLAIGTSGSFGLTRVLLFSKLAGGASADLDWWRGSASFGSHDMVVEGNGA